MEDINPYELPSVRKETLWTSSDLLGQVRLKRKDQIPGGTSINTGAKGCDWVLRETLEGLTKPFFFYLCLTVALLSVSRHWDPSTPLIWASSVSASGVCT